MTNGPFTIVWEAVDDPDWVKPDDDEWERHEQQFTSELDAVREWGSLHLYTNTRPVSITPEPDWSKYVHGDGKTPVTKW